MIAAAVLALVLAPVLPGQAERVEELLAAGRLGEAWAAVDDVEDPLAARRVAADVLYRARDFAGTLAETRAGLALAPEDLHLRWRAATASLWLRDGGAALEHLDALGPAIERLGDPEARAWWTREHDALAASAEELVRASRVRDARLRRARLGSLGVLAVAVSALVALGPR